MVILFAYITNPYILPTFKKKTPIQRALVPKQHKAGIA